MSKPYLNFNKKNNPLAAVINQRTHSPNLSSRTTQKEHSFHQQQHTKLYTFCASDNKPPEINNDENTPHLNNRERKISLGNLKGKVYEAPCKQNKPTYTQNNKDKVKANNLTITSITTINPATDRRKIQKPNSSRNQEKKINISVCINPKTFRETQLKSLESSQQKEPSSFRPTNMAEKKINPTTQQSNHSTKAKIVMEQEELKEVTHRFALQKYHQDQQLQQLQQKIHQLHSQKQTWHSQQQQYEQQLNHYQLEVEQLNEEIKQLKNKLILTTTDNQYYLLAKEEAKHTLRQQQTLLSQLQQENTALTQQLARQKQNSLTQSVISNNHERQQIKILEIQNNHLKQELLINQQHFRQSGLQQQQQHKFNQEDRQKLNSIDQELIRTLLEENQQLKKQMKAFYLEQIHSDIYKKTIEQCTLRITQLQEENQQLKHQTPSEYQSKTSGYWQQIEVTENKRMHSLGSPERHF